jgi:hypothetical protein
MCSLRFVLPPKVFCFLTAIKRMLYLTLYPEILCFNAERRKRVAAALKEPPIELDELQPRSMHERAQRIDHDVEYVADNEYDRGGDIPVPFSEEQAADGIEHHRNNRSGKPHAEKAAIGEQVTQISRRAAV